MKGKIFSWSSKRSAATIVVYENRFRPEGRENFHLSRVFRIIGLCASRPSPSSMERQHVYPVNHETTSSTTTVHDDNIVFYTWYTHTLCKYSGRNSRTGCGREY
ncbi:hypothetical protein QTP88_002487 [Uroleucon formosanum]